MSRPKRTNIAHRLSNWRWSLTSRHLWVDHQTSAYYSFNRHPFQSTFVDGSVAQLQLFVSHFDIQIRGGVHSQIGCTPYTVRILNPQKYPWIYCFFFFKDFFWYFLIFWGFFIIFSDFFYLFFLFCQIFCYFYYFFGFILLQNLFFRFCQIFGFFLIFF